MKKLIFVTLKTIEIILIIAIEYLIYMFYRWIGIFKLYDKIPIYILTPIMVILAIFTIWLIIMIFSQFIELNKNLTDKIYKKIKKK